MRYNDVKTDVRPEVYVTFRQALNTPVTVVAKTALDPASAAAALRTALSRTDPTRSVTFTDITTLDAALSRVLAQPRFYLVMVGVFAVVAFLLASLGIYGTMMFWVGDRWREFGIRIALGANRASVASLLLGHGLGFAAAGMAAGLVALAAGRRLLSGLLFQVAPADPIVLASAISLLTLAAFVAGLVPARRIARVDPVTTLRAE
jgi:putative ABC transport system permease protein